MTIVPVSDTVVAYLSKHAYRAEAKQQICIIPLSGLYWEDEMPEIRELLTFSEDDRLQIFRLFAIRYRLWDGECLSEEEEKLWNSARSKAPNAAIFQRLTLSAADRQAHEDARQSCEEEFEQSFSDADRVTFTDLGSGVQSFSATFDLTGKKQLLPEKQP